MHRATTLDEYRKYIEKDAALERRFQPVMVDEPTIDQANEILLGIRTRYEEHHHVKYTDEALRAAVDLSVRYVADRRSPTRPSTSSTRPGPASGCATHPRRRA